jgi:hypothetical protein
LSALSFLTWAWFCFFNWSSSALILLTWPWLCFFNLSLSALSLLTWPCTDLFFYRFERCSYVGLMCDARLVEIVQYSYLKCQRCHYFTNHSSLSLLTWPWFCFINLSLSALSLLSNHSFRGLNPKWSNFPSISSLNTLYCWFQASS